MSRRVAGISLALLYLLSSEVWALGLGDIRLDSALGEPLRAEIELLSATAEELDNLTVALASAETFQRYGLDRPFYLQDIEFTIVRTGRADGNVVQLRSRSSMAEPFLTFLVEATWSRGRLLREYTVLLDPPTFAPPVADTAPAVQAPSRSRPADSGQIQRPAPAPQQQRPAPQPSRPAPAPAPAPQVEEPKPQPPVDDTPYDTITGGDVIAERGSTLWGIASRVRPDSRLTMNQTMLAIFEANPEAFGGNINILRAGASLRIPSADEIFRINRRDAFEEAKRHHAAWGGGAPLPDDSETRPSLTLVPPDEDYLDEEVAPDLGFEAEPLTREQEIEQRIAELEGADVPQQQSLIEIRDNELAALRQELAEIRGEIYEPLDDVAPGTEDPFADDPDADILADESMEDVAADEAIDEAADADEAVTEEAEPTPSTIIQPPRRRAEPSFFERVMGIFEDFWMWIIGAVVLIVGGLLFWFMRRGEDDDEAETWQPLDSDETLAATAGISAPVPEDAIVVVEQESAITPEYEETVEAPAPDISEPEPAPTPEVGGETGTFDSLEDTFSSETAINLDQSDPIAEADFHMAYGLYDQAADLVTGALDVEPDRQDLLTKLCEIYFVWGNRDAFVDAAGRLKAAVGDAESEDWNKIVIMGQQIASDSELFAGESAAAATKAVDLSFEADMGETGALDMELIADAGEEDVLDIGAGDDEVMDIGAGDDEETAALASVEDASDIVDFDFGGDEDTESEDVDVDITREMPTAESTIETPTIEQQFDTLGGTAELPSIDEAVGDAIEESGQAAEETAEINLDDLGLDVDSLAETELASLDDLEETGLQPALEEEEDTGINEEIDDVSEVTGKNPEVDPDATGLQVAMSEDDTGINEALESTGIMEAPDENLLDATGMTQVLSSDHAVDTTTDAAADLDDDASTMLAADLDDDESTLLAEDLDDTDAAIGDDQETMLASLDEDDDAADFDFAKTEALPKDAFTGDHSLDETGEMPAVAGTDMDLDLDDLTAALQVSDAAGDTVEQPRDDATVQQPRPVVPPPEDEGSETMSLSPDDMSEDLHDARTMTEVGTKLDLARAYVDMGDPAGARSILEEVLDEGDEAQRQQAQQLLDSLPS
jgi:pilus assembly protein FimV